MFRYERRPTTRAGHRREETSIVVKTQAALVFAAMKVHSSSACSSLISKSRNCSSLKRFAAPAARSSHRVIVLRDCVGTTEHVETAEGGWANWLAIRYIECNVGYTSTAQEFIRACEGAS